MSTDAPLDEPAERPLTMATATDVTPTNTGPNAAPTAAERHMHAVPGDAREGLESLDGDEADKPSEPHPFSESGPNPRASREAIAARAFQVYSDHVTATARSMHETPTEELHRRHDQAAKARHGLNIGHKLR